MTLVVVLRPRQFTIAGRAAPVNARPGHPWRSRHLRLLSRYLVLRPRAEVDGPQSSNALIDFSCVDAERASRSCHFICASFTSFK